MLPFVGGRLVDMQMWQSILWVLSIYSAHLILLPMMPI